MARNFFIFITLMSAVLSVAAQERIKKTKPSRQASDSYTNIIPGYFTVDFGFNRGVANHDLFQEDFWGSRTVNIYYNYSIRLWKSKFSFVPSLGLSLERFKFSNNHTISPTISDEGTRELVSVEDSYKYPNVIKSMIITNYVDFPIGFRFDTNPEDLSRSFYAILGVRIGVLYESFAKIKYKEGDETKAAKHTEQYGLSVFRYGAYSRIGVAGFNIFFVYNLSPLFEMGKGPDKTNMNTFTVGISLGNL